jgi:hypothetical protein
MAASKAPAPAPTSTPAPEPAGAPGSGDDNSYTGAPPATPAKYAHENTKVLAKVGGRMKKGVLSDRRPREEGWEYRIHVDGDTAGIWISEKEIKTTMK